jgi:hypothetical protein
MQSILSTLWLPVFTAINESNTTIIAAFHNAILATFKFSVCHTNILTDR